VETHRCRIAEGHCNGTHLGGLLQRVLNHVQCSNGEVSGLPGGEQRHVEEPRRLLLDDSLVLCLVLEFDEKDEPPDAHIRLVTVEKNVDDAGICHLARRVGEDDNTVLAVFALVRGVGEKVHLIIKRLVLTAKRVGAPHLIEESLEIVEQFIDGFALVRAVGDEIIQRVAAPTVDEVQLVTQPQFFQLTHNRLRREDFPVPK
jgi:hypothetical protein